MWNPTALPTYYIAGLNRQENAADARRYLEIEASPFQPPDGIVTHYLDGTGNWSVPVAIPFVAPTGILRGVAGAVAAATIGANLSYDGTTLSADQQIIGDSDDTHYLDGDLNFKAVRDTDLSTSDVTTNNVSIAKHGFTPKLPNDATKYLDGTGNYTVPPTGGSGTVTNTGTLIDHAVCVGNGGVDISTIAVGATNTVLHGNTGADPSFSAVVEADITLADNTTNNVTTARHGLTPKLPNDGTVYLDGQGNYTVPPGGAANPAGADKNVQYNNAGAFGGISNNATASNKFLRQVSSGTPSLEFVTDADLSVTDLTTNNVLSTKHGFAPKSPGDATKFLNGAATPSYEFVKDSDLATSDITTNNTTIAKHGFAPKLSNNVAQYLDGTGGWSVPPGGTGGVDDYFEWKPAELVADNSVSPTAIGTTLSQGGTNTAVAATQYALVAINKATAATTDTQAFAHDGNQQVRMDNVLRTMWAVQAVNNTDARYFIGMMNTLTVANILSADIPTSIFAGFRFSTTAGDTNWMAVFYNGTSSEAIDTAIPVDNTKMPRLELRWDGTASNPITFWINGNLVAQTSIAMPAAATTFAQMCGVRTLANVVKNIRYGFLKWQAKPSV